MNNKGFGVTGLKKTPPAQGQENSNLGEKSGQSPNSIGKKGHPSKADSTSPLGALYSKKSSPGSPTSGIISITHHLSPKESTDILVEQIAAASVEKIQRSLKTIVQTSHKFPEALKTRIWLLIAARLVDQRETVSLDVSKEICQALFSTIKCFRTENLVVFLRVLVTIPKDHNETSTLMFDRVRAIANILPQKDSENIIELVEGKKNKGSHQRLNILDTSSDISLISLRDSIFKDIDKRTHELNRHSSDQPFTSGNFINFEDNLYKALFFEKQNTTPVRSIEKSDSENIPSSRLFDRVLNESDKKVANNLFTSEEYQIHEKNDIPIQFQSDELAGKIAHVPQDCLPYVTQHLRVADLESRHQLLHKMVTGIKEFARSETRTEKELEEWVDLFINALETLEWDQRKVLLSAFGERPEVHHPRMRIVLNRILKSLEDPFYSVYIHNPNKVNPDQRRIAIYLALAHNLEEMPKDAMLDVAKGIDIAMYGLDDSEWFPLLINMAKSAGECADEDLEEFTTLIVNQANDFYPKRRDLILEELRNSLMASEPNMMHSGPRSPMVRAMKITGIFEDTSEEQDSQSD